MKKFDKIIFVAKSGNCRAPMAMELLKVQKLDVEAGEVAVTGLIYCLNFTDKGEKTQQSLLGKMFR